MSRTTVSRGITPNYPFTLLTETTEGGTRSVGLNLNYDFNASVLVEESTGYNGLGGKIFANLTAKNLSVLLWAMVQANHPEFRDREGLVELRSRMTHKNSKAVSEAVQECYIRNQSDEVAKILRDAIAAVEAGTPAPLPNPATEAQPTPEKQ